MGNYYIEIVRNQAGKVSRLYRIPAQTMKVKTDKTVYCQTRNEKHVWFKRFALEGDISSKTGKPMGPEDKPEDRATEVIHYRAPYPKSDYYGAPNILSAIGDLVGLIGCRDFNLSFFDNFGIPSAIITLTGDWDSEAETKIRNFLKTELKGAENGHKSLVISQTEDAKVEIKPLDPNPIKDLSFKDYEKTRKENILIAYSMPPERVGMRVVGQLGGNVAEESTKVYTESVIEPLQQDMEAIFNMILRDLGITKYQMKFQALDLRNMAAISDRHVKEIEHGILTPNQALNELGLQPYEGGNQHYIMANLVPVGQEPETVPGIKPTLAQLEKAFDESKSGS
jgi:PBSX family phage portal protein